MGAINEIMENAFSDTIWKLAIAGSSNRTFLDVREMISR